MKAPSLTQRSRVDVAPRAANALTAISTRERFVAAVEQAGGARVVAQRLACSRSYIDMLRAGSRRPGMRVAHAIEREFGIPMKAWLDGACEGA